MFRAHHENRAHGQVRRACRQRRLLDFFDHGSTEWAQADSLLVNFESLAQFVEDSASRDCRPSASPNANPIQPTID
jgi:hypothetical protein